MTTNHDREQSGPAGEDPALVRAWREASHEQPPAQLDAAILAAARRSQEVEDPGTTTARVPPRTRSRWMRWQPLAAAATVAGLAFALIQTLPREQEVAPPIRMQVPEPAPSAEREAAPPARGGAPVSAPPLAPAPAVSLESRSSAPASVATEAPTELDAQPLLPERGEASSARSLPAETADVADTMRSADQRKGVMTDASGEASLPEAAAPATERTATRPLGAAPPPSAAVWASRIEALHASGDLAAAAASLRDFRAVDPDADARLPESLREWARTVE